MPTPQPKTTANEANNREQPMPYKEDNMRPMRLRNLLMLALCLLSASIAVASEREQRFSPQEFMRRQEAFITQRADLTPTEASAFFKLYREKEKQNRAIREKMFSLIRQAHNEKLTDKESKQILHQMAELDLQRTKLENAYRLKYCKVLSPTKVLRVIDACKQFDHEVMKRMIKHGPPRDGRRK